jgi:hypothetical protein
MKQIAPKALVALLYQQDHHLEDSLCLALRLFDRIRPELHRLLVVFASVLPYRLLEAACPLHLLCHSHNILVVGDNFDLAVDIRFLSRHHSYLGILHHSPARSRHCSHHIRSHLAGTDRIAAEDTVEAAVARNLVEDLVFEPLPRCTVVVAVDSSLDRMPLCCWIVSWSPSSAEMRRDR